MRINGKTRVLGIIGWPVAHSLSPVMHNAVIDDLGIDFVYVPFPVEPSALGTAIQGLRSMGVWGFNVTIPHKTDVIPFLDRITREAELAGAVNTVYRDGELLVGHNTDGIGFLSSLRHDLGRDPDGLTVLLLGAGGAPGAPWRRLPRAGRRPYNYSQQDRGAGAGAVGTDSALFSPGLL